MSTSGLNERSKGSNANCQPSRGKQVSADSIRRRLYELGIDIIVIETDGHSVKLPLVDMNRLLERLEVGR